jgi:hypothetical protein
LRLCSGGGELQPGAEHIEGEDPAVHSRRLAAPRLPSATRSGPRHEACHRAEPHPQGEGPTRPETLRSAVPYRVRFPWAHTLPPHIHHER